MQNLLASLCCRGASGTEDVSFAVSSKQHANHDVVNTPRDEKATKAPSSTGCQIINHLRAQLASADVCWASRLASGAAVVAEACDASVVSFFGTTVGSDGKTRLVTLASVGPAAAAVPAGEVLPLPGTAHAASGDARIPPLWVPPWEPPASLRAAAALRLDADARPAGHNSDTASGEVRSPIAVLDSSWQRLTNPLRALCPSDGAHRWCCVLAPAYLGTEVVGAALVALPRPYPASVRGGGARQGPQVFADGGSKGAPGGEGSCVGKGWLREPVLTEAGVLEAVATCVAECCIGPVLPALVQVCSSCVIIEASSSLHALATIVSHALTSSLASEFHVDLGVRLAILPYKDAHNGVLFDETPGVRTGTGGMSVVGHSGGAGASSAQFHRSASLPFVVHTGGTVAGKPSLASPQPSQLARAGTGVLPSCRGDGQPAASNTQQSNGGVTTSRVAILQAAVSRDLATASVPASADDVLAPTTMSLTEGHNASRSLGGGRVHKPGRGNLTSPRAPNPPRGQIKACTLPLASTLASALLGRYPTVASTFDSLPTAQRIRGIGSQGQGTGRVGSGGVWSSSCVPALCLTSTVVASVSSFLHDAEQPSADVYMVFKRSGGAAGPACLVLVAACWQHSQAATGTTGNAAFVEEGEQSDAGPNPSTLGGLRPWQVGTGGGGGPGAYFINASQNCSSLLDGGGTGTCASAMLPPAFVLYLTSTMQLPPPLLEAIRGRATSLVEVFAPAAARALAGAAQDEWSYLSHQAAGGPGLTGLAVGAGLGTEDGGPGSFRELSPAPSVRPTVVGADGVTMSGVGTGERSAARLTQSSMTSMLSAGEPLPSRLGTSGRTTGPASTPTRSPGAPSTSAVVSRDGRGKQKRGLLTPQASGEGEAMHETDDLTQRDLTAMGPKSRPGMGTTGGVTGANKLFQGFASGGVATLRPPSASQPEQQAAAMQAATAQGTPKPQVMGSQLLDTGALSSNTFVALEEDADTFDGISGRGGEGPPTCPDTGLLSTVLSDTRGAAKEVRQQQMDIMVSTFHEALSRARHEGGAMVESHAEEDVRSLRLVRTLGHGGCSVVLLAHLHAMPVAVKVILPPEIENEEGAGESDDGGGGGLAAANGSAAGGMSPSNGSIVVLSDKPLADVAAGAGAGGGAAAGAARVSPRVRQAQLRIMLRGARELAVMTSISHPNIVQVYSFCTRVVVKETAAGVPLLEVVPEGAPASAPLCTALIMEYCDMGSLADAIDNGSFGRAGKAAAAAVYARARTAQSAAMGRTNRSQLRDWNTSGGVATPGAVSAVVAATAGTPAMRAAYLTLLEVALALRYLHALHLVHCDVKPANVLLRSSATDPRGFTSKLTDFGFVNLLEQQEHINIVDQLDEVATGEAGGSARVGVRQAAMRAHEPVGTVTHMAPELFIRESKLDSSVDIYAFGILMWELATGRPPYPEFAAKRFMDVPYKVVKEGMRPRFPRDTPLHFSLLAQECWSSQPSRRPTAAMLVTRLQKLLDVSCGLPTPARTGEL